MVTLSASVMAHPDREQLVADLLSVIGEIPVAWDDQGPPTRDMQRRWWTGRRAWELHDPNADWHLVLQDDAMACPDLIDGLQKALDALPGEGLVCPYLGRGRPIQGLFARLIQRAVEHEASWVMVNSLCWGISIVAPTATVPDMLEWCDDRVTNTYDTRVGRYYRDVLCWPTYYTWPSLVDHREGQSLVGHSNSGRRAFRFHGGSALELDWSGPLVPDARPMPRDCS